MTSCQHLGESTKQLVSGYSKDPKLFHYFITIVLLFFNQLNILSKTKHDGHSKSNSYSNNEMAIQPFPLRFKKFNDFKANKKPD